MKKNPSQFKSFFFILIPLIFGVLYFLPDKAISWFDKASQISQLLKTTETYPKKSLTIDSPLDKEVTRLQMGTSPDGSALRLILSVIHSAQSSIYVASYSFTNKKIAQALVDKHRQGIMVRVVMDKSQNTEKYSSATFLANAGIPVHINHRYAIQHSKIMIVDERTVETGSFNFTQAAATKNSENVLVIWNHTELAKQYIDYWNRLWSESEPYHTKLSR